MKRNRIVLCLLLAALMTGCGKPDLPPVESQKPATYDEAAIPEKEETQPQIPDQTTLMEVPTDPQIQVTVPTEPTTTQTTTAVTDTAATFPLPTEPTPIQGSTLCGHDYQPGFYQAPTCLQAGYQNYHCQKCGDVQQQISLPLGHSYTDATCTAPKNCIRCGTTEGAALEHHYTNSLCSRCGKKDPSVRTITIQVKDSKNKPVDGVTVELYIADALHSTSVSNGGKVTFTVKDHTGSYTLVLTQIPEGYKPQKDCYTYRSDSGAIVLDIVPVVYPDDHSKAAYKVGSAMGDFNVTDVDGKTYQLSQLLQKKKLVILNFWYYTCMPCKAEFPYFNSVYQKYNDDIEILGLNHFDSESKIRQLQAEMNLSFPLATEHLGMQQGFGIQSYPVSVFIGSNGRILKIQKDVGFQSEAELEALVRSMLDP